ncbi:ATP-binding protein [Streptosporangium saharense]|uniref:Tetratricopeptide (TPR) repeat protein n=1 Tax=Streptosporangium saharense TaxID=1706840 RepID=A0A7W7QT63_9ACTN|nr:tetratricopeptide repeat protein [Streptosporangium saharense]MBB4918731.1 tetratricopeptide (TPR) repeat protein [Streptosporangium saharense]
MSGSSRDVVHGGRVRGVSPAPVPRQLPADVRGFVNRVEEFERLNAVLTGEDGDPRVISVCVIAGTAGVGKTSLALRWAHQIQERFPDGQLYVNLRGYDPGEPVTAYDALHRFLVALGVRAPSVPQDLDAAAALYRSLLAGRRMLVVLDNAAMVSQVRPLLPGSAGCLVVVTSRSRLSILAVREGAHRLTLGTLPEAEAVALLRAVTAGYRPEDDEAKLTELARLCARLPLALRIAAERAVSYPHMRLDDLIADLRDESALWDALSTGDDEEAGAVRTVFAWSYRALPEQVARLFRLLGLHPGPEFGLYAAAALCGLTPSRTRQLLDSLVGAHLLEQATPGRYQFHDLLRAYAADQVQRDGSSDDRESALRRVLEWYLHTAGAAQSWISPAEDRVRLAPPEEGVRPLTFADYDAAVDWSEREHANLLQVARTATSAGYDELTWQLAVVLANIQPPSAPVADWLEVGRLGLTATERLGDRAAQARLLTEFGIGYVRINRLDDSLESHRRALEIRTELDDRIGQAHSLNLIGLVNLRRRRLDDAARHFERAVVAFREQGSAHWEATTLANLASTHYHAGRLTEAEQAVRRALEMHRFLESRRGEGNALRLLSDVQREQGEVEPALTSAHEAVEIALALRNHRLEGFWLIALGNAQRAAGQFTEALSSYQRSATLHRRLGDRSREALAWYGVGRTYRALDRHAEAADFHRQAAAAHHALGDAWHEALDLDALAEALVEDPEAARRHRTKALGLLTDYDDPRAVAFRHRIERRITSDD